MVTIATQTAIGELGRKAVTELSYSFDNMVNVGHQYGCNSEGIFLLNNGEQDDDSDFTRTFTVSSSDYGTKNLKRFRFIYIGIDTDNSFTVSVMSDNKVWRNYDAVLNKTGLQQLRVPVGRDGYGRYWKVKITSTSRFRIDSIVGLLIIRPLGIKG